MRWTLALPLLLSLGTSACDAQPVDHNESVDQKATSERPLAAQPVTLQAADGVAVHGEYYQAAKPRALIVLFHQAGSSKDEYRTIAPRLVKAGFSALAIDQRAGGGMFGSNETAAAIGHESDYLDARPDLQAALDWAQTKNLPIILWGSSYSSSLIFPLAAGDPNGIIALLAFSPGEYFDDTRMIRRAASRIDVPVFIASTSSDDETSKADPIMAAVPKKAANVRYVPRRGVHGSSTLIESRNPAGAEANWEAVLRFLDRVVPRESRHD